MFSRRTQARSVVVLLVLSCAFAHAQEEGETPGAIASPGSYNGGMQLQREEQQQFQQQQEQNQQMQQRLDATYQQYAPRGGAVGAAAAARPGAARPVDWWSKPTLAPEHNPLLGKWKQIASKGIAPQQRGSSALGDAITDIVDGAMAGGCKSMFGTGTVAFAPDSLDWVAPDGHQELLNHIAYRTNGTDIVVLTRDPGALPQLFVGMPNHDHAVVALLNCSMERLGTKPSASGNQAASGPIQSRQQAAPPPTGTADAILNLRVGATATGQFAPFSGVQIWVTTEDPQGALVRVDGAATGSVSERLATDCHDPSTCARDWKAMSAKALGSIRTDAAGRGNTPTIPHGRYYLVGHAGYENKWLFWHQSVDLRPGSNEVTLDQTNGSLMQ